MPKTAVHLERHSLPGSAPAEPAYRRSRRHSVAWWLVVGLSWVIVLYGAAYLILRSRIFPPDLAESFKARPWGIYPHVIVGMIALAIGPLQFHPRVQNALDHATKPLTRYRCAACGFEAKQHFWQCPGCQAWDSYPARRVEEL